METNKLYQIADQEGIEVGGYNLPENKAVTVNIGDKYFVGIDLNVLCSVNEERVCLAHELGHCIEGAVYDNNACASVRNKQEAKALRWAIERLVPLDKLKQQLKCGNDDLVALADYFEVTLEFMYEAVMYYRKK